MELKKLEQKAKSAWKCYFMLKENYVELSDSYTEQNRRNRELVQQIRSNQDIDINFLKSQFVEMYDLVKKNSECPVCMEVMTKDTLDIPYCGHLICKGCKETIKTRDSKCPCCRKAI